MDKITFDVMLEGRWQATLNMPVTGGVISDKQMTDFVETCKPSLKGKNYKIEF